MKRLILVSLFVGFAVVVAFGQSGRRAKPTPTPEAVSVDNPDEYSESRPAPKRPVYTAPSLRSVSAAPAKSSEPSPQTTGDATSDEDTVLTVNTDLVTIPVSVFDRNGLYIPNLRQSDFKVFEDGKEQTISYFGTADKPFTVILLIDVSPSTAYQIDEIHQAAIAFVDNLKPVDKVMVIEFDRRVHVLAEPTGDRQAIYKAIRKADFGSGTALYEAVDFTLKQKLNVIDGRKAIVLFTDGVDTQSGKKTTYDSTLDLAEEADAMIFPIYYNTFQDNLRRIGNSGNFPGSAPAGTTAGEYAVGKKYLEELASYTGGRVFRPESTPGGLTAAFAGIAEELRRQYTIGYIPNEDGHAGQRKTIRVRVNRPNLVLRTKDSYIVGNAKQ